MTPTFTTDWHSHVAEYWRKFVKPLFIGKPTYMLELGSYEGRSALWSLDNFLTHPDSKIDCVDLWCGNYEENFDNNISLRADASKVLKCKGDVFSFLVNRYAANPPEVFDVIYIDADHQAKSALTEAALCWRMLKKGGVIIFDDYPWQHPLSDPDRDKKLGPKKGIDAFLDCWQYEIEVLHHGYQVIIQKI